MRTPVPRVAPKTTEAATRRDLASLCAELAKRDEDGDPSCAPQVLLRAAASAAHLSAALFGAPPGRSGGSRAAGGGPCPA